MAVRHSWPSGNANAKPKPRAAAGVSATKGLPPVSEKRPITDVRPGRNTAALDRSRPLPLLSKYPVTTTPLAWFLRKPGCSPKTVRKRSMKALRVNPARGPIHLLAYATPPRSTARNAPTAPIPSSTERRSKSMPRSDASRRPFIHYRRCESAANGSPDRVPVPRYVCAGSTWSATLSVLRHNEHTCASWVSHFIMSGRS